MEKLLYSDYVIHDRVPSKLIPGATIWADKIFKCPRCKNKSNGLDHGVPYVCPKCNLWMVTYGNGLQIEDNREKAEETLEKQRKKELLERAAPDLLAALQGYLQDDECVNTPDAPDFKPGPHTNCRFCTGMAALAKALGQ